MPIHETPYGWVLESAASAYALGVNASGRLTHCYWGARLPHIDDYPAPSDPAPWASFTGAAHLTPEEYPAYGGASYVEPCLKITFADGVRDTVLQFVNAALVDGSTPELRIELRDVHYPLLVTLSYRLHEAYDLVERAVTLTNGGEQPLLVERVWSAQWHLPPGDPYYVTHATGRWNDEGHIERTPIARGVTVFESRRLTTSHQHSPWVFLEQEASEEHGNVFVATLGWSGNWQIAVEATEQEQTRVSVGVNDWDWALRLAPHTSWATPPSIAGYSAHGFGGASRNMHRWTREQVLPHGDELRPVLYNSWEATGFDVDVASQGQLAEIAAGLGVELFVMDDGWFHRRDHDRAGLGDWWPDARKFSHGLQPLIRKVQSLGMTFGLWLEPEMVNPDSDLYRAHPDWVIHFPTRARTEARNQLILNMARRDVQDHLIATLDALLRDHDIRFIKWDMNRNVSEPGWADAPGDARELWTAYVHGLYHVWGELARRHPRVRWQSCSGGGGRADVGILRLADQVWPSDNTEATARLRIQHSYNMLFPPNTMEAWVTDMGREQVPLRFRFHVSMCGVLGVGGNLHTWSADERAEATELIAQYKQVRHLVQHGDLYRLHGGHSDPCSARVYVAPDKSEALLFAFRTYTPDPFDFPLLRVTGLDPQARYAVEGVPEIRSGLAWHHVGLQLSLSNFGSAMLHIKRDV